MTLNNKSQAVSFYALGSGYTLVINTAEVNLSIHGSLRLFKTIAEALSPLMETESKDNSSNVCDDTDTLF